MALLGSLAADLGSSPTEVAERARSGSRFRGSHCRLSVGEDHRKKGEVYGFEGDKKVKGRKRHLVVDSQGLLLGVLVPEANCSDRLGAVVVLEEIRDKVSRLEGVWVDQGYSGERFRAAVQQLCGEKVRVEVIEQESSQCEVLPHREHPSGSHLDQLGHHLFVFIMLDQDANDFHQRSKRVLLILPPSLIRLLDHCRS